MFAAVSCDEPPRGNNSQITGSQFTFGEKVTYECNYGYESGGRNTTRTCGADGTWSGEPLNCRRG